MPAGPTAPLPVFPPPPGVPPPVFPPPPPLPVVPMPAPLPPLRPPPAYTRTAHEAWLPTHADAFSASIITASTSSGAVC
ncbi:hypothetical protein DB771_25660 [Burkholderia sp. AU29985]|nr:hypothetical protein EGY28_21920 [Burkholderia dolosa]ETP66780.1 hypothetical protein BDSB_04615 [Burkholderia dolosa PC543]PRE44585.1 hypothetical protein C6P87_23300 [Burkholderia sp. AU12872]PUA74029.1 hypothetical protein DB771_25660 [Burkholderia sp. AU29985]